MITGIIPSDIQIEPLQNTFVTYQYKGEYLSDVLYPTRQKFYNFRHAMLVGAYHYAKLFKS